MLTYAGRACLLIVPLALTLVAVPASAQEVAAWRDHVREAAVRFAIPEAWIWRVMAAESGGRTQLAGRPIMSRAGAMGLMQVMPATWASLRARHGLGSDPHDPRDNILAGTAYLRAMYDRFGYPGLFAAYNAGPGRYGDYLARGRPLPRETRDYVAKIAGRAAAGLVSDGPAERLASVSEAVAPQTLFFARADRPASVTRGDVRETVPEASSEDHGARDTARGHGGGDNLFLLRRRGDDRMRERP
jgi:hypothetical protein